MMGTLAARLAAQGGAALVIDYGYTQAGRGETLQAVKGHAFVDPLAAPGETDLTAHVDFSALARTAEAAGTICFGPVAQGTFLRRLGIRERAAALSRNATPENIEAIEAALARLVSDMPADGGRAGGMGGLFKVLCVAQRGFPVPAGFEEGMPMP
jgi:SAM-dependent MidA family methyltransferase